MGAKTIKVLDESEAVIGTYEIPQAPTATTSAVSAPLPQSLDWYRDAAKWLVTSAAGILAIGLTSFGEADSTLQRWLFTASALMLIIAVCGGAWAYLWIAEFGKHWENRAAIAPSETATLQNNQRERNDSLKQTRVGYHVLLGSFVLGALLFAITCGVRMWWHKEKRTFIAQQATTGELYAIDSATGETWMWSKDRTGHVHWIKIVEALP